MHIPKNFTIFLIILISVLLLSSIEISAKNNSDQVGINAMVCDACHQSTVILQREYRYSTSSVESKLAGSNYYYCNYCHATQKFNHFDVYNEAYDCFFNWHECLNCGWKSDGYTSKTLTSSTYMRDYDKCTVCGMEG